MDMKRRILYITSLTSPEVCGEDLSEQFGTVTSFLHIATDIVFNA